ncbi:hypothetical protein GQ53DRAFT_784640 [Thozetella sp. PMI_491]|nr:hypothetical protein GQ53DRAFT_784640 [Thozetella sp. PMI_491]
MNPNYMGTSLSPGELQRQLAGRQSGQQGHGRNVGVLNTTSPGTPNDGPLPAVSDHPLPGGDSLDDIISQNENELNRRRSVPQPFNTAPLAQDTSNRRLSMLDYSAGSADGSFHDFQFADLPDGLPGPNNPMVGGYGGMSMQGQSGPFPPSNMLAMSDPADLATMSPDMISFSNLNMGQLGTDPALTMFDPRSLGNQLGGDPVGNDFDMNIEDDMFGNATNDASAAMGLGGGDDVMMVDPAFTSGEPGAGPSKANLNLATGLGPFQRTIPPTLAQDISSISAYASPIVGPSQPMPLARGSISAVGPATPASVTSSISTLKPEKSLYSRSGFDMMRALWYVVSRKNPEVQLGAVDMSCAFVVCDVTLNDCPIIYVSDNFQNLTGYSRHEIIGKNCRFLQAPDGKVEAGSQREFVENDAVYRMKRKVAEGQEIQQSLINYRKGGKPFLNLLTMIPIPWDSDEIRYFIGFQIDLVECPDAITGNDQGGAMQVNYIHNDLEQYIWTPPTTGQWGPENGQTLALDDVSTLLQQFNPATGNASEWHKQSWDKMLLENSDDVVHVLSLKGLFLYLSPSCKRVLEWDTSELVGTSLADICHPSDIIPATRELKDTGAGGTVDIAFRIRRKNSGYMWFESHGSLFVEQGKGRKCVILVGRKRPIYNLSRAALEAHGGIGDSEIWTKLSTSGMFLFVSSNIRSLLDLQPQNLVGTSMQDLMRKESRPEFGRSIEKVRTGKIATCKHEVQNKRGQVLQAETALFPGDVPEGQKPTFILAKTRLLKASLRSHASGSKSVAPSVTSVPSEASFRGSVGPLNTEAAELMVQVAGNVARASTAREDDNIFGEFGTTKTSSWQYELRQMEKDNRKMAEDLALLLSNKKKRKRRKGGGNMVRDCANCHTRNTPEWRRGPSGNRDLCNSCGLRWAKQTGRVSPRNSSRGNDTPSKKSNSPIHSSSPLQREMPSSDGAKSTKSQESGRGSGGNTPSGADTAAAGKNHGPAHNNASANPPQSQPLLEGGSGSGGGGMEMEAIREEREASA